MHDKQLSIFQMYLCGVSNTNFILKNLLFNCIIPLWMILSFNYVSNQSLIIIIIVITSKIITNNSIVIKKLKFKSRLLGMETLHCQTWPGSFDTFAQMQHFHFTCSSWFRLTEMLLTSLWGVNLWNVLWSHKDEREVGLLWFTAGARTARNLHLFSAQYIKNMGRFAAHSVLHGVFCCFGRMDRSAVSSETADGLWNRLRLLLSTWSIASGGTRGSQASCWSLPRD